MYTVDIDTGGTMTDSLITEGANRYTFKTDTTPHDFTVSFIKCLDAGAQALDYASTAAFLKDVSIIRWSSTITTNVLGERRGSKVGLLVSEGHEKNLYGHEPSEIVGELVDADNVIGMSADPQPKEILDNVKSLLENSVRRVCVSRQDAFPDNSVEKRIKALIEDQYPDHFLGSVPVLLGSEMAQIGHDQTRAHYSVMNAYTHTQLATALFKAEDLLRDDYHWERPLFIGHTTGGVGRVGKTKAVDTIESGPVFGTFGGAYVAREYGIANAVCLDVGGTTSKVSVVKDGQPVFQRGGRLMGIPVQTSFAMLRSLAIGGGSIAKVQAGELKLGPESTGATPGPACYGLGGKHATLTDALVVLGYLDPKGFLGGRRELEVEQARTAIKTNVADPLDIGVGAAALAVRDKAAEALARLVNTTLAEAGLQAQDVSMFTFGGNGPTIGAYVAQALAINNVYAFDLGPVFSAFGSAISDVVHVYERGVGAHINDNNQAQIIEVADDLYLQATRDLQGEGFDPAKAKFNIELEFGEHEDVAGSATFESSADRDAGWYDAAKNAAATTDIDTNKWPVLLIRLTVSIALDSQSLQKSNHAALPDEQETRAMVFTQDNAAAPIETAVKRWGSLGPGSHFDGPAMINGETLTCPVPPGWQLDVDDYGNARLSRKQG